MNHPQHKEAFVEFSAFNTEVALKIYGSEDCSSNLEVALAEAQEACRIYENLFSRTIPSSDIARLNDAHGEWVRIDARTADVLRSALHYCEASTGVFDITVGSLCEQWDFRKGCVPDAESLEAATLNVDWHQVDVVAQCGGNWFARLSNPEAHIDLGGIAKGWIADRLAGQLSRHGASAMNINLGGNVLVKGMKPDGSLWRIGIIDPRANGNRDQFVDILELSEGSVVTSGTYIRSFSSEGRQYHHVLDPRTGLPVETEYPSVSVVARKSIDAEGFSTTLLALGLKKSRELAKDHPEIIQAYFVSDDGRIDLLRP